MQYLNFYGARPLMKKNDLRRCTSSFVKNGYVCLRKIFSNELVDNVVEDMVSEITKIKDNKTKIDNQEIIDVLTVNGVRFTLEDGSWGLIRASSNKPSLVIVTESPISDNRKIKIFRFIDDLLQKTGRVGEYDQKI